MMHFKKNNWKCLPTHKKEEEIAQFLTVRNQSANCQQLSTVNCQLKTVSCQLPPEYFDAEAFVAESLSGHCRSDFERLSTQIQAK